jgi:hypothetical protein
VRGIQNRKTVIEGYENVQAALLDYTLTCYPSVTVSFLTIHLETISEIDWQNLFEMKLFCFQTFNNVAHWKNSN